MGLRDRPISPRSPWQNPYAERLIGTFRRDSFLDHVLIFGGTAFVRGSDFVFALLQRGANAPEIGNAPR